MNILQPTRLTFWRFVFLMTAALPFLSIYQLLGRAKGLGVDFSASTAWTGLTVALGALGLLSLLLFALTWSRFRERMLSFWEFPERAPEKLRWFGILLLVVALVGYTIVFMFPLMRSFFNIRWTRLLIFWSFSLMGMWGIKFFRRETPWFSGLVAMMLCQSTFHLLVLYWPRVTAYPFAMGWSETSRFYYPSLFLSEKVYGQPYPWPILHPTLHLLLLPPYWFDAPLWVHRFWRVVLAYLLVAAAVPALLKRLSVPSRAARWLIGLWMFLYLYMGPIYFHLTVPVVLVLLGFSSQNDRRTWIVVLLASIWCGWSRVNWYPMPGIIAAVLFLMEVPYQRQGIFRYLLKPALWFIGGTLVAFISQRVYIALSGTPDSNVFYSSFTSDLLWYRLWPNSSFSFGILPGIIWSSLPLWLAIYISLRSSKGDWHPLRLLLLLAALLGGMIVSLKIGGGANLHNMDAYFILLLICAAYLIFARYRRENGEPAQPVALHWLLILLLLYNPVSTYLQFGLGFKNYDAAATQKVLTALQDKVDTVNAQGGEILFITQRHLLSMHMLDGVTLIPEYEREDLMELAMANNVEGLAKFRRDMKDQRFALIVVDPLNDNTLSRRRSFSEENNVWVTRVVRYILCNYRQEAVYPADEIAVYVPLEGARHCP